MPRAARDAEYLKQQRSEKRRIYMKTGEKIMINGKSVDLLEQQETHPEYETGKKQVFIIGSKGIPAAYGGFETFAEKLTENRVSDQIRYHIARIASDSRRYEYNGAKCFNVKVPDIGPAKAIWYDMAALQRCIDYCKERPAIREPVFYVLACRIGPFIEGYKKQIHALGGKLYVNPDGHEWKRGKWNAAVRRYWKISEELMVKHADLLICDSKNIEAYIQNDYYKYHPDTTFIAYGSDVGESSGEMSEKYKSWLTENGLKADRYYLVVGRFVPENNFETMIREFMRSDTDKDLAIITTPNTKFMKKLEDTLHFQNDPRIRFPGSVYDPGLLKEIRENAYAYLHGHEVGGTNPSLLEALGSTKLNLLLDVGFNSEVAEDAALYWDKTDGCLARLIGRADSMREDERERFGQKAKQRIRDSYSWPYIVSRYEDLFLNGKE